MMRGRLLFAILLAGSGAVSVPGCAHVRAYEREYLQDPIMSLEADAREEKANLHWIEAREGSTGGAGAAGGGCACN
jgi:hypothetical protein